MNRWELCIYNYIYAYTTVKRTEAQVVATVYIVVSHTSVAIMQTYCCCVVKLMAYATPSFEW